MRGFTNGLAGSGAEGKRTIPVMELVCDGQGKNTRGSRANGLTDRRTGGHAAWRGGWGGVGEERGCLRMYCGRGRGIERGGDGWGCNKRVGRDGSQLGKRWGYDKKGRGGRGKGRREVGI